MTNGLSAAALRSGVVQAIPEATSETFCALGSMEAAGAPDGAGEPVVVSAVDQHAGNGVDPGAGF